jgi:hypothetical protein
MIDGLGCHDGYTAMCWQIGEDTLVLWLNLVGVPRPSLGQSTVSKTRDGRQMGWTARKGRVTNGDVHVSPPTREHEE